MTDIAMEYDDHGITIDVIMKFKRVVFHEYTDGIEREDDEYSEFVRITPDDDEDFYHDDQQYRIICVATGLDFLLTYHSDTNQVSIFNPEQSGAVVVEIGVATEDEDGNPDYGHTYFSSVRGDAKHFENHLLLLKLLKEDESHNTFKGFIVQTDVLS